MNDKKYQQSNEELNDDSLDFFVKIGQYMQKHPEFAEEMKYRIDEDKFPKIRGLDYYVKHGFRNLKEEDIENVTEQIYNTLFEIKDGKKSLIQRVSQDAFKKLISGYLSENYFK